MIICFSDYASDVQHKYAEALIPQKEKYRSNTNPSNDPDVLTINLNLQIDDIQIDFWRKVWCYCHILHYFQSESL